MSKSADFVAKLTAEGKRVKVDQQLGQASFATRRPTTLEETELDDFLFKARLAINGHQEEWTHKERDFATKLLHILFADKGALQSLKEQIQGNRSLVRIIVQTSDNHLSRIPWELCANADLADVYSEKPLENVTVARTSGLLDTSWVIPSPVRILVLGTRVAPKYEQEFEAIQGAFSKKDVPSHALEMQQVDSTDPAKFQLLVKEFTPHIIHLVTHGDEGELMLQNRRGDEWRITPQELARWLPDGQFAPSLFVSTACLTARSKAHQFGISNIGSNLSKVGIPAVIGMQFQVTPLGAIKFAEELYRSLAFSQTLTTAFVNARNLLFNNQSPEWAAPVLYISQRQDEILLAPSIAVFLAGKRNELRALHGSLRNATTAASSELLQRILKTVNTLEESLIEESAFNKDLLTTDQYNHIPGIGTSIIESRKRLLKMLDIIALKKTDSAAFQKYGFFELNEELRENMFNLMGQIGELNSVS